MVKIGKGSPAVSIYPNPVTNGTISLQLTDMPKGTYQLRLLNSAGQLVFTQQITHAGANGTQTITLVSGIAKGNYFLEMSGPEGWKMTKGLSVE